MESDWMKKYSDGKPYHAAMKGLSILPCTKLSASMPAEPSSPLKRIGTCPVASPRARKAIKVKMAA
jgi:hypothetical protein